MGSVIVIWWDEEEKWYKAEDTAGNWLGWCSWSEPDSSEECVIGALDVYNMAMYIECK